MSDIDFNSPSFRQVLKMIEASAYAAYSNSLSGNQSPKQKAYFDRMSKPEVGDMVLEVTAFRSPVFDRLGKLLSRSMEPYPVEKSDNDAASPVLREVWVIERLDGEPMCWENCDFIVIPEDPFHHQASLSPKEDLRPTCFRKYHS